MKTPPERWTGRIAREDEDAMSAEDRAAVFLRRSIVRQPLAAGALAGVRDRITPAARAQPGRRWALRVAVGIALFLSGGGVVMSATLIGGWAPFHHTKAPARPVDVNVDGPIVRRPPRTTATAAPPAVEAPRPAPPSPIVPVRHVRSAPAIAPTPAPPDIAPPPAPEPARPSALAEESALIGAALRRLRETDDAAGALALLDEHDARFGSTSALADEAATTRVEALLRIGSLGRALALLDKLTPPPGGRGRELLATRGELRADAARCSEALADFEPLLAAEGNRDEGARDLITERALYGRAACRTRLGEHDAARADLETYLARFPAGRFAARARAALDQ